MKVEITPAVDPTLIPVSEVEPGKVISLLDHRSDHPEDDYYVVAEGAYRWSRGVIRLSDGKAFYPLGTKMVKVREAVMKV